MKRNIIFLDSSGLNSREVSFWNALIATVSKDCNCIFFSTADPVEIEAQESFRINYNRSIFSMSDAGLVGVEGQILGKLAEYDRIWDEYEEGISEDRAFSWYTFWNVVLGFARPAAVFIWGGFRVPEKALQKTAGGLNIQPFIVERGPFAGTYSVDQKGFNFRSSFRRNFNDLEIKGTPADVALFAKTFFARGESNWDQPGSVHNEAEFREKYQIPIGKQVIFFPSQIDRDTNSKLFCPHFDSVFDAYSAVVDYCNKHCKDIYLLAKAHPRQETSEAMAALRLESGCWVEDAHIFDCIRFSNGVVSINSASAVEAALIGKPVLILGQSILSVHKTALILEDRESFEKCMTKLLRMIEQGIVSRDNEFFQKLLLSYLFTTDEKFKLIGLKDPIELLQSDPIRGACSVDAFQKLELLRPMMPLSGTERPGESLANRLSPDAIEILGRYGRIKNTLKKLIDTFVSTSN